MLYSFEGADNYSSTQPASHQPKSYQQLRKMMSDSSAISEDKGVGMRADESRQDKPVLNESGTETDTDDKDENEGPTSSVENIIPLNKLKNGWFALSAFVAVSGDNI